MKTYHHPKVVVYLAVVSVLLFSGCANQDNTTNQENQTEQSDDIASWVGRPVSELDKHPAFLLFPEVRTTAADGTKIRHYVIGRKFDECFGNDKDELVMRVNLAQYDEFINCMQKFVACNKVFYIKNDTIDRVSTSSTGGAHCDANENLKPDVAATKVTP
jgi:hypothetical protein